MQAASIHEPTPTQGRRRRWWRAIAVVVLLLLAYAVALAWVARRLEVDVQQSLHPLPAVQHATRADD
jgi:hypothetical protein